MPKLTAAGFIYGCCGVVIFLAGVSIGRAIERLPPEVAFPTGEVSVTVHGTDGQYTATTCSASFSDGSVRSWPGRGEGMCLMKDAPGRWHE